MVHGRHAILPADSWIFEKTSDGSSDKHSDDFGVDIEQYKKDLLSRFRDTYRRASLCLQKQYNALKIKADKWKSISFDVGEDVWVYLPELQRDKDKKAIGKLTYQWYGPMTIVEKHPESDVLYLVITDRQVKFEQYVHVNRLRKYVSRENRPRDQVLPVPTYDINWDQLPLSEALQDKVTQDLNREIDEEISFDLVQHERREPTVAEEALIGKVFIDEGDRYIVRLVRYHLKLKVIMCWYEKLKNQGSKWVGTG